MILLEYNASFNLIAYLKTIEVEVFVLDILQETLSFRIWQKFIIIKSQSGGRIQLTNSIENTIPEIRAKHSDKVIPMNDFIENIPIYESIFVPIYDFVNPSPGNFLL